jgi:hypothetical protein
MPLSQTYCFSVILTSTAQGREIYQSLDEMPPVLRATCVRTLQGPDAATLLIADHGGRQALLDMMDCAAPSLPPLPLPQHPAKRWGWLAVSLGAGGLALGVLWGWAVH